MAQTAHARRYMRRDGSVVRAVQFDGRVAGFAALLSAFPGRIAPHPHRDDAVLVIMDSERRVRIEAGDWVAEEPDGSLRTHPQDQFDIGHSLSELIAA